MLMGFLFSMAFIRGGINEVLEVSQVKLLSL
jgi:hypothetical protein